MVSVIAIFSSHIVTDSLFVNKPKPYLIITGIGISYFLVQHHFHKRAPKPWKLVALVLFGILSKITIAPFFLVFILMFPNIRSLAKATSIGIGISATIVAIFFSEFKAFLAFILKTSSHSGMYGTGNVGFYCNLWQENLLSFLRINPILLVLLLAGLAHALFFRRNTKIVITLFASYVIFFVFILKNPYSHYFIPCYFILPAYLLISFEGIRLKKYKPFVFAICIVLLGYRTFTFHCNINIAYSNWKNLDHTPSIQAYHNSTKAYCLISSNISQGNTHSQVLTQLFPKDTVYLFDKTMHTASKQIDYTKIKGTYTISGSSEHIEQNKMLQIIRKRIVGEKIIYTVITKD